MNDTLSKVWAWVKSNILITILILLAVGFMFFGRQMNKLFGIRKRVKHRRVIPRSVGTRRSSRKRVLTKSGKVKKPWQIKGSEAARRHMAKIRSMR
jgi:hypothetical protein